MTKDDTTAEKRIVDELEFDARTSKRVTWEAWEFTVEGPHLIRVTNASYGFQKDDHSYTVGIEERDGLLVPAECECPADVHREGDCKHKVALATVGGPVVLQAAVDYQTPGVDAGSSVVTTAKDKLRTDGGVIAEDYGDEATTLNASEQSECDCDLLPDDFPCWPCVRDGKRELPE